MKVISWNLWHRGGAVLAHLSALIEAERPDLLLMQEAKPILSELTDVVGGHFHFLALPRRVYGLGAWIFGLSPVSLAVAVTIAALPTGINAYLFAARYDAATPEATSTILLSTLLATGTMTVLLGWFSR